MADTEIPRAVLVDDNLMFTSMLVPALQRLGYGVRAVPGKTDVAVGVAAFGPQVIFVNLAADRYSGTDVVRALRLDPATAQIPIVGYAGHVERDRFQAGQEAGADLVVPNSAMRDALGEVLAKLQRRLAAGQDAEAAPNPE
ncbi:MAG TPA: response regulator [Armatimonadota bacterium]|nr:response regulator [Armatimonadota bacterium]